VSGLRLRLIGMLVAVMLLAFGFLLVGVNFGLRNDVQSLAQQSAETGANVLAGVLDVSQQTIRQIVQRESGQAAVANAIDARDTAKLRATAFEMVAQGELSFVVFADRLGSVIASNRAAGGDLAKNSAIASALSGSSADGFQQFTAQELTSLGITARPKSIALVHAEPVRANGKTVGVIYAGEIIDSSMHVFADVNRFTGGGAGIAVDGTFSGTSLRSQTGDAAYLIGVAVPHATDATAHQTFTGLENIAGVEYMAKITPLASFDGSVLGAYWFGAPYSQFHGIVNNTLRQIVFWGVIGLVIALIVGAIVATRIGRAIVKRSEEVNESAQQLKVLVVGAEVSGDHVTRTRDTLAELNELVANSPGVSGTGQLKTLSRQAADDVLVIDTLTSELSTRLRDAAVRVERLSAVAQELDELVAGAKASRN
jgi:methyl-accepting chemotaxis protein